MTTTSQNLFSGFKGLPRSLSYSESKPLMQEPISEQPILLKKMVKSVLSLGGGELREIFVLQVSTPRKIKKKILSPPPWKNSCLRSCKGLSTKNETSETTVRKLLIFLTFMFSTAVTFIFVYAKSFRLLLRITVKFNVQINIFILCE